MQEILNFLVNEGFMKFVDYLDKKGFEEPSDKADEFIEELEEALQK